MKTCEGYSTIREEELCGTAKATLYRVTGPGGVWADVWLCSPCYGRLWNTKRNWRFVPLATVVAPEAYSSETPRN